MTKIGKPVNIVPKGWGQEIWIHNDDAYCGKLLEIKQAKIASLHFHRVKQETFYCLTGQIELEIITSDGKSAKYILNPGDIFEIPPALVHRFKGLKDSQLIEVSTKHEESDSYRIEKGD